MGDGQSTWANLPLPVLELIASMGDPSSLRLVNSEWRDAVNRSITSFILRAPNMFPCLHFINLNFKNLDTLGIVLRGDAFPRWTSNSRSSRERSIALATTASEKVDLVERLAATLTSFARLKNLKLLSDFSELSRLNLQGISNLTKLTSISIHGPWTDGLDELSGLVQLRCLDLSRVKPAAPALNDYTKLSNLTSLTLRNTRVPGSSIRHVVSGLSNLTTLCLQTTRITNDDMACVLGLRTLKRIDIGFTQVSDAGVLHLKNLTELTYLSLRATRTSDSGVPSLLSLSNLEVLILGRTFVTGKGLSLLTHLQSLRVVNAVGIWSLTQEEIAELQSVLNGICFRT